MNAPLSMCLHQGAQEVSWDRVVAAPRPVQTKTHYPLQHADFVKVTMDVLADLNIEVTESQHALWGDNDERYFGLARVALKSADWEAVVGLRNANDKRFAMGWVIGASVFVCDNLSFMGELGAKHKHTVNGMKEFVIRTETALATLPSWVENQDRHIDLYKGVNVDRLDADHLMMDMMRAGVYSPSQLGKVDAEWSKPHYEDFEKANAWSLFNAVTYVIKRWVLNEPERTIKLHRALDEFCGVPA